MTIRRIWAFIRLTRPVFLLGGALLYGLGVAYALRQGFPLHLGRAVLGQVMVTVIQLMAQYANEYYDVEADRLNTQRTWFTGGSGVLSSDELPRNSAWRAAFVCAAAGWLAIAVTATQSPLAAGIGALCLLLAWCYSAPPLSLMSSGWGELSASLTVAVFTPLTGYAMQTGQLDLGLLLLCIPLAMIHIAMLIAFELPDWESDAATHKQTLVVRWGRDRAVGVHAVLIILSVALLAGLAIVLPLERYAWAAAPLAIWQVFNMLRHARSGWSGLQWLTLGAVGLFTLAAGLVLLGLLVT